MSMHSYLINKFTLTKARPVAIIYKPIQPSNCVLSWSLAAFAVTAFVPEILKRNLVYHTAWSNCHDLPPHLSNCMVEHYAGLFVAVAAQEGL